MFLNELLEPKLLVFYPGRFQPWHKGHFAVYRYLLGKFGRDNVFITTSNKIDPPRSPFNFAEKSYFMQLTGVSGDRIIQATQPYQIDNILASSSLHVPDPSNTVAIFAISEKDMAEDPRFKSWTKKDGSPAFFQPLKDIKQTESIEKHAYVMTVPTFDFTVLGQPMKSGTELRKLYSSSNEDQRRKIVQELFGRYTFEAQQLLDSKIGGLSETAGVGVVSNSKDPRYVMSTLGNQNDVTGNTLGKEIKDFYPTKPSKVQLKPVKPTTGR